MIDLNSFFKNYDPSCSHHIAAVNCLMDHLPKDLLLESADWINTWNAAESEWGYNEDK